MHKDARGLDVTAASAAAVKALDAAIDGYLSYRSDIAVRMETLFAGPRVRTRALSEGLSRPAVVQAEHAAGRTCGIG